MGEGAQFPKRASIKAPAEPHERRIGIVRIRHAGATAKRKYRSFADSLANAPNRPFASLQDRHSERAGSARKRSSAEGVGCAISGSLRPWPVEGASKSRLPTWARFRHRHARRFGSRLAFWRRRLSFTVSIRAFSDSTRPSTRLISGLLQISGYGMAVKAADLSPGRTCAQWP